MTPVLAKNKWNGYHWERSANPITVPMGDNVNGVWDGLLGSVSADWSASAVLDTPVVAGSGCLMTDGTVQVCNGEYGINGWLGLATIRVDASDHILAGTAKVNDSYFNTATYDNDNARRHVICQEVGHPLGLDHQKKPRARSCMNDNWGLFDPAFISPNGHDYDTLDEIYAHLDGSGGGGGGNGGGKGGPDCTEKPNHPKCRQGAPGNSNGGFGKAVGRDDKGRDNQFEKDLGGGNKRVTFVTWAD